VLPHVVVMGFDQAGRVVPAFTLTDSNGRTLSLAEFKDKTVVLSKTGRSVIVFNGEAYNLLELKRELEARGATFRSSSDTEVLLEMLEREGQQALVRLDAMFAT
jgi:asparagine synthetase B (glutamine-hydrolysing)